MTRLLNSALKAMAPLYFVLGLCFASLSWAQSRPAGAPEPTSIPAAPLSQPAAVVPALAESNPTYTRAGFTFIYLKDETNKYANVGEQGFRNWRMPAKFDENQIKNRVISFNGGVPSLGNKQKVTELLTQNQVFPQIAGRLFNEKQGLYNYERLYERARYMMNDNAVLRLRQSSQGVEGQARTDKWIMPLIANTYVAMVSLGEVQNWREYYDEIDNANRERARRDRNYVFAPVRRSRKGYKVSVYAAVYQLELKDTVLNDFFDRYWADSNTAPATVKAHLEARSKLTLPMKLVVAQRNPSTVKSFILDRYDECSSPEEAVEMACDGIIEAAVSNNEALK